MNCLSSVSGGGVAYLRQLVPALVERVNSSTEHTISVLAHEQQLPYLAGVDSKVVRVLRGRRLRGARRMWWEQRNLPGIVREVGTDLLFTPYQVAPRVRGVRNVLMLRNMEPFLFERYPYSATSWLRNSVLRTASARSLTNADRVIAVSGFAATHLITGLGMNHDRVRIVHHGSPPVPEASYIDEDRVILNRRAVRSPFVLTCGSLLPYRRCEDVIAAFEIASARLPRDLMLVIAGSGSDARYASKLRRLVDESSNRERILMPGHVASDVMEALYRRASAVVVSTEIEACPNIALEAMAAGCAIISADRPPLPEVFAGASLEYPARDVRRLAEQIVEVVGQWALQSSLRERARARSRAFSWHRCATETFAALVTW
jgi:glycosyltransferase involved in cell wall biosynthesis